MSSVEVQLEAKGYAIGSFLDIEGAFDSTSMQAINQARIRHKDLEALMDWIEDMLADRNLTISHGDTTIEDKPDQGCAQGVVLSPLLWCVMVNDLLEDLQPLSSRKKASSHK
jgi:hypothetical protein